MHRFNLAGEEAGMGDVEREQTREKEQVRRAKIRLRRIQHYEQVTKNVRPITTASVPPWPSTYRQYVGGICCTDGFPSGL